MVKNIHENDQNVYMRNVNGTLELVYHNSISGYKNPGTGILGEYWDDALLRLIQRKNYINYKT